MGRATLDQWEALQAVLLEFDPAFEGPVDVSTVFDGACVDAIDNDDGTTTTWGFEAEGPQDLMHGGVRKSDLPPGARITVTARPMRDGRPAGIWSVIVKDDGTLLNWRTPGFD